MTKIIGITGPSGSGKSLLCKYIAECGIPCIDADEVYHGMLIPPSRCLDALSNVFGEDILTADGTLNRVSLSERVFSAPEQLERLNSTVLPIVVEHINDMLSDMAAEGATVIAVDAPTLIESGFHKHCDLIIAVLSPIDMRIDRIEKRDHISKERAMSRVSSQKSDDFYTSVADITLVNDQDEDTFADMAKNIASSIAEL